MKTLLVSKDRDAIVGLRLAGIEGKFCSDNESLKKEFDKAKVNENIGIIILTESDFDLIREDVFAVKKSKKLPLVVTIPNRGGLVDKNFILKYVKESIGVKID